MTNAITRDDKIDYKVDDNISLPGIAGYVLSDNLHCLPPQRPQTTAWCGLILSLDAALRGASRSQKKAHRLGVKTASTMERQRFSPRQSLGSNRRDTPRRRPPPNKGETTSRRLHCFVFHGGFLSPKNHVWKGKGELP